MKKKVLMTVCIVIAMIISCMAFFTGCGGESASKEYTIQYTDDSGTHQITVTSGMPYSMESVPEKTGYTFAGLFDAEVGGTQYVSSSGASLSPFTDGKNMVLFPQFKAKEYTIVLDYQGAEITGSRQLTAAYGNSLPELPKNLTREHMDFAGWYTEANCKGTQIADAYGLVPIVSVLNDANFDVDGEYIYLYAGFSVEKFTVTCYFEDGMAAEEVRVEYNMPASQIKTKTRVNDNAPLTWSKSRNGEVFNGNITADVILYAVEYAPIIEFDSNGGSGVNYIVARAGSTIALPTPTKDMAKFAYWEDAQGNEYTSTTMPSKSITLKAVWNAKIVFDSNGGSDVDDISVAAGEQITLPTPEKEGYIFAGWYTAEKDEYMSKTMPSTGIKLKAGWYKEMIQKIIVKTSEQSTHNPKSICKGQHYGPKADWRSEIDLSQYIPASGANVQLEFNAKMAFDVNAVGVGGFYFYDDVLVSESNFLKNYTSTVAGTTYKNYNFETQFTTRSNTLYICYYAEVTQDISGSMWKYLHISDIWFNLYYPDTTNLYL